MKYRAVHAVTKSQRHLQARSDVVSAALGNGAGTVETDQAYIHWVRIHGDINQRVRAINTATAAVNNLRVDLLREVDKGQTYYEVLRVSRAALIGGGAVELYPPEHSGSHEFYPGSSGRDAITVYLRAISPLRPVPQQTLGMTLYVEAGRYETDGESVLWSGGSSPTFVAPVTGLRYDLLYMDIATGTLMIETGVATTNPLDMPTYPDIEAGMLPLAYVRVGAGSTTLNESSIIDIRPLFTTSSAAATPHDPVTLGSGSDPALELSGQELTLTLPESGFEDQAANTVLAGPIHGADDTPDFRTLITSDLPLSLLYTWQTFFFSIEGFVTTGAKPLRIYMPGPYTIDKVFIAANTAPVGAALTVDVEKNGTTIFTDQGKRPSIAAGANTDESDTPDVTALVAGDYLTFSVDQVGSSVYGSDLTVHVRCKQTLQATPFASPSASPSSSPSTSPSSSPSVTPSGSPSASPSSSPSASPSSSPSASPSSSPSAS